MHAVAGDQEDERKNKKSRFREAKAWATEVAERGDNGPLDGLVAIEQLINGDETFVFDGFDCPGPCGWDGIKLRCFCAKNRVYWVWVPRTRKWRAIAC